MPSARLPAPDVHSSERLKCNCLGLDPRPVLHGLGHLRRERRRVRLAALRTLSDLSAMLRRFNSYRRQVKHLALLIPTDRHLSQRGLTTRTPRHGVHLHVIRLLHSLERIPRVRVGSRASCRWTCGDFKDGASSVHHWMAACCCCDCSLSVDPPALALSQPVTRSPSLTYLPEL